MCAVVLQEARNMEEFAAAHGYLGFVDTPTVIWELTTTRCVDDVSINLTA
jgi:predicted unusual protein kinase regulating ubiquinone biosynthesis (AarF/ABC1/UbiB family)